MADEVPAFDDIPSFDDLPDAASQQSDAVPAFDDIPSFDALPDESANGRPAPETALGTGVREAARAVVPTGAGLVGAGLGGAAAGALGAGPIGAFVGGVAGMVAASMGAGYAQDAALDAAGFDDSAQRSANIEAHPVAAFAGGLAPGVATMSPMVAGKAAQQVVQRGAGAVIGGAFEAGQDYINEGHVDPTKAAAAAAVGAVFPAVNRVGQKFVGAGERLVPGRPNRTANPAADQAHVDVADASADIEVGNSSLAQSPHVATGETTGNPQSAPSRSSRVYSKGVDPAEQARYAEAASDPEAMRQFAFDEGITEAQAREIVQANYRPEGDMLTRGDADPATVAALEASNPQPAAASPPDVTAPIPGFDDHPSGVGQAPRQTPAVRSPEGLAEVSRIQREAEANARQKVSAQQLDQEPPTPSLDVNRPAKAQAAIERSIKSSALKKVIKKRPDLAPDSGVPLSPEDAELARVSTEKAKAGFPNSDAMKRVDGTPEPVVEAGFPRAGEPVAVGENEVTPMPQRAMPELKGETPINDSVTEGQRAAGNYPKARTHDFGKPVKVETHAGDTRRGKGPTGEAWEVKLPYDYGYFNKTKGADKDHIDFARPKAGDPAQGDKHFIIDQKNAETGKFDEHKVFTYYADEAAARQHYAEGFSDGKGPDRLGAITEVSRGDLVKFLAKHTSRASNKPFGAMEQAAAVPGKKDVRERAVYKDLLAKKPEAAEALAKASDDQIAAAIEGKRVRKYGVGTGASAGYPVEGVFASDGRPVTANTKAKATERSTAHKKVQAWFEKSAPKSETETKDAMIARLIKDTPDMSGWKPTHKPAAWLLAREAQNFIKKPTPAAEKKFREAERLLRGAPEDVEAYRGGNRIEADIARSRRSGDEAVAGAEAKNVDLGRNSVEDEMIANIDAKKAASPNSDYWSGLTERTYDRVGLPKKDRPKFDVPHEEAEAMVKPTPVRTKADLQQLPKKTVSASDSSLAKIDTKAISASELRKAEAARLAGKKSTKAAGVESEGAAAPVRQIKVLDKAESDRLLAMLGKATSKPQGLDALPAERVAVPKGVKDLLGDFVQDDRGSVDIGKIKKDFDRWMSGAMQRTEPKSYRAKTLRTAHDEYVQALSDDLHKINQEDRNHFIMNLQKLKAMPDELKDPGAMARIYAARDKDSANFPLPAGQTGTHIDNLPPKLKALYDEHLKPMLDQNDDFVAAIRAVDPDRIGPDVLNHIARITKGDTAEYNLLKSDNDPTQPIYNGLSVSAAAAKLRKFYALEGADGRRHVIQPTDNGFVKWEKYKRENIKDNTFEFEDGKAYKAGPNTYVMRQATTKEIMDHARGGDGKGTPMKYYTNAGFSAAVSNSQLGSMMRHLTELQRITDTPQFKKLSTRNRSKAEERGWEESTLPNMKGTYLHPELKAVFDDFAGHPQGTYRKLNSAITKMLFWMPVAHINNVWAHHFVGRGWDNFSVPKNYRMVVEDAPRAIISVVNQDAFQMQLRSQGAGTIYGSVVTRRLMEQFAKKLQIEMETEPSKWGPMADKLGVPLKALGRAVYDTSAKVMWSANDVFIVQRVMELMRKDGFKVFDGSVKTPEYLASMRKAITEAERDIPNYRIPHVIGSNSDKGRMFAKFMGDPALTAFGRYHYGMYNSYANIIKDAVSKHSQLGDRVDAAGKLLSMGVLALAIYPVLDQLAKWVTDNEGGKAARRGPVTVPSHLKEAAEGKQDVSAFARGSVTIPPLISAAIGALSNKDFRGKAIVEPGDVRNAFHGSGPAAARAVTQPIEYAARSLISPVNTFASAIQKGKQDDTHPAVAVGKAVRDAALDFKDPSKKAQRYEKMVPIKTNRDALSRFKQGGSGPIEGLVNKATGYK
jgi:hypothetical protein